jgi:UDP-N-acetylglucosamine:LPS N-acetylglucosamine transferase
MCDMKRVMAVASGGGHWVQLMRLRSVLARHDTCWVTVQPAYREQVPQGQRFYVVTDATRWSRWELVKMVAQVWWLVLRDRPEVLVTTGAAPGLAAMQAAKLLGARTVWIDSVANVEHLSMSGRKARRWADLWLTQWPHLAKPGGPRYLGAVL